MFFPVAGGDPYYSSVGLLLPMTGENSGIVFTDYSPSPKTVTRYNAVTSTVQSKWGAGSGYFDGSGDYLTVPSSTFNFSANDFTIECFCYLANASTYQFWVGSNVAGGMMIAFNNPAAGDISVGRHNVAWDTTFSSHGMSNATWYHVALVRSGSSLYCFVNGIQIDSTKSNSQTYSFSDALHVGTNNDAYYLSGYLNDLRITNSIARYTANFTPPGGPFPPRAVDLPIDRGVVQPQIHCTIARLGL